MEFIEKPDRVDRKIQREIVRLGRLKRRLVRVKLNRAESRIFWEDLIEGGQEAGDPEDDSQFQAFLDRGDYNFVGTIVKLNIDGV